jgi:hypothetical protein
MQTKTKTTVAAIALASIATVAVSLHPIPAQTPAPAAGDELVRYGPLVARAKDIAVVTHEETKKLTSVYVIPAPGQPPLKIDFSGDDSLEAWKQLQQPPVSIPTKPTTIH